MLTRNTSYKRYTVVAADASAGTKSLTFSEVGQIGSFNVLIIRSGKAVFSDPAISASGNVLTVADGSSYALTAGDELHCQVWEGA